MVVKCFLKKFQKTLYNFSLMKYNSHIENFKNRRGYLKMKKIIALLMSVTMLFAFAGCGTADSSSKSDTAVKSDMEYVKEKGKLVVGITVFEPMDYQDADGKWVGFDADMATAFAESLDVDVEFQIIDWESKAMELKGKTIDVVWNGMTLTDEVTAAMDCSNAYFNNAQVVIVKAEDADKYKTVDSVKGLSFAVENGSAGAEQVAALGADYTPVADQATALTEVMSGTADAAVIDFLMAISMIGEGTSYEKLTHTVSLNEEKYGVGFRKNSDLVDELNEFFKTTYKDGTMKKIAEKYGIEDYLVVQE